MTGVAYLVRCQHCGVARKSYNDPRRGISVIECKRPCGNSHYNWTYIQTIPENEVWPQENVMESIIPVYLRPTHQLGASCLQPKLENLSTPDSANSPPTDKKNKHLFCSEGHGSTARLTSAAAGDGTQKALSSPHDPHRSPSPKGKKSRCSTVSSSKSMCHKGQQNRPDCSLQ
ncbi:hypothetical protein JKF63_00570 [Porcisia hertigi]|uniref:Uncharacterized protein n=1 Tax=Porcisia hertigi TaxID=2761500 RepID=A0A836I8H8_9TRYP|nr:hypothetical protein JKF63_00570 [Porcisia hertigi]